MERAAAGLMVELSTNIKPSCAPAMMPSLPRATSSTSGVSGRLVKITSTCAATSAGEDAGVAPSAAQFVHGGAGTVVYTYRESGFQDIAGYRFAHQAETNVSNFQHGKLLRKSLTGQDGPQV